MYFLRKSSKGVVPFSQGFLYDPLQYEFSFGTHRQCWTLVKLKSQNPALDVSGILPTSWYGEYPSFHRVSYITAGDCAKTFDFP